MSKYCQEKSKITNYFKICYTVSFSLRKGCSNLNLVTSYYAHVYVNSQLKKKEV